MDTPWSESDETPTTAMYWVAPVVCSIPFLHSILDHDDTPEILTKTRQVEKQQSERQRKFSHSRGVAPATQLDYPLFGSGAGAGPGGPRRRPLRGRPEAPPAPPPTSAAPPGGDDEDNKGHGAGGARGGRAAGAGGRLGSSTAAAIASSLPFPSGRPGGRVRGAGAGGGSGDQGGPSWPQKPGPPPWPAQGNGNVNGDGNGHGPGHGMGPLPGGGGGVSVVGGVSTSSGTYGRGYGAAPTGVPFPPQEPPRGGGRSTGLRKRPGKARKKSGEKPGGGGVFAGDGAGVFVVGGGSFSFLSSLRYRVFRTTCFAPLPSSFFCFFTG